MPCSLLHLWHSIRCMLTVTRRWLLMITAPYDLNVRPSQFIKRCATATLVTSSPNRRHLPPTSGCTARAAGKLLLLVEHRTPGHMHCQQRHQSQQPQHVELSREWQCAPNMPATLSTATCVDTQQRSGPECSTSAIPLANVHAALLADQLHRNICTGGSSHALQRQQHQTLYGTQQ